MSGRYRNQSLTVALVISIALAAWSLAYVPAGSPAAAASASVTANLVTITVSAASDAYVDAASPGGNFGAVQELRIGWAADGVAMRRAFVRFDIAAIPGGSTIDSARLRINTRGAGSGGDVPLTAGRATNDWTENGVTWGNQPIAAGPYSLASAGDTGTAYHWDLTTLVSGWIAGSYPNYGICLSGPEGQLFERTLGSREASAVELVVVYHAGPPIVKTTPSVFSVAAWYPPVPQFYTFTLSTLDLAVTGIEVTQSIQCYASADAACSDNSVPLVLNKGGLIRVTVRDLSGTLPAGGLPNVPVRLTINAGGYISVVTSTVTVRSNPLRANLNDTANMTFRLTGNDNMAVQISATVNPNGAIPEANSSNNTFNLPGTTFWFVPPLRIVPVGVIGFVGANIFPSPISDPRTFAFLRDTYPVPSINVRPGVSGLVVQVGSIDGESDWGNMLAQVQALKDNDPTSWAASHWYALVAQNFPRSTNIGGYASIPSPTDLTTRYWSAVGLNGNWSIAAQEIAHNLGRLHAPQCANNIYVDPNWPLPNDMVGDFGWDQGGYDGRSSMSLTSPTRNDLMGYCGQFWISGYTARGIFSRRLAILGSGPQPIRPSANQDYIIVSGGIISGSVAQPLPFQKIQHAAGYSDDTGAGPYSLEMQSLGGDVLFVRNFDAHHPGCSGNCAHDYEFFHETVPYTNPAISKFVFKHGSNIMGTVHTSLHPPTVTVTSPNGGEAWGLNTAHTISWSANDPDGDPLAYHVLFSHDGGVNWSPLATFITTTQLSVHATQFPGTSQARIRVIALDGVRSSSDDSDADFSIERKPPNVSIHSPNSDFVWPAHVPLVLNGSAHDLQDGDLSDQHMVWTSDRDGIIGQGGELLWAEPSVGDHTITLTATNANGDVGSASVSIHIGMRVYLPGVTR